MRMIPVGAGTIVGQNESCGHACMRIAELHRQVRKHNNGQYWRYWPSLSDDCFAKAEYNGKACFATVEASNRTLVHYCDVLLTICCGVTLFHPNPCGADLMSALRILMFPGGTGFWS